MVIITVNKKDKFILSFLFLIVSVFSGAFSSEISNINNKLYKNILLSLDERKRHELLTSKYTGYWNNQEKNKELLIKLQEKDFINCAVLIFRAAKISSEQFLQLIKLDSSDDVLEFILLNNEIIIDWDPKEYFIIFAKNGKTNLVKILIERYGLYPHYRDKNKKTVLDYAKENGHKELLEYLQSCPKIERSLQHLDEICIIL